MLQVNRNCGGQRPSFCPPYTGWLTGKEKNILIGKGEKTSSPFITLRTILHVICRQVLHGTPMGGSCSWGVPQTGFRSDFLGTTGAGLYRDVLPAWVLGNFKVSECPAAMGSLPAHVGRGLFPAGLRKQPLRKLSQLWGSHALTWRRGKRLKGHPATPPPTHRSPAFWAKPENTFLSHVLWGPP